MLDIMKPVMQGNTEARINQLCEFYEQLHDIISRKFENLDITDLNYNLAELIKKAPTASAEEVQPGAKITDINTYEYSYPLFPQYAFIKTFQNTSEYMGYKDGHFIENMTVTDEQTVYITSDNFTFLYGTATLPVSSVNEYIWALINYLLYDGEIIEKKVRDAFIEQGLIPSDTGDTVEDISLIDFDVFFAHWDNLHNRYLTDDGEELFTCWTLHFPIRYAIDFDEKAIYRRCGYDSYFDLWYEGGYICSSDYAWSGAGGRALSGYVSPMNSLEFEIDFAPRNCKTFGKSGDIYYGYEITASDSMKAYLAASYPRTNPKLEFWYYLNNYNDLINVKLFDISKGITTKENSTQRIVKAGDILRDLDDFSEYDRFQYLLVSTLDVNSFGFAAYGYATDDWKWNLMDTLERFNFEYASTDWITTASTSAFRRIDYDSDMSEQKILDDSWQWAKDHGLAGKSEYRYDLSEFTDEDAMAFWTDYIPTIFTQDEMLFEILRDIDKDVQNKAEELKGASYTTIAGQSITVCSQADDVRQAAIAKWPEFNSLNN